jgi:hypothetical protein
MLGFRSKVRPLSHNMWQLCWATYSPTVKVRVLPTVADAGKTDLLMATSAARCNHRKTGRAAQHTHQPATQAGTPASVTYGRL